MEKRLVLALALCMAYVFFVMPYFMPEPPKKEETPSTSSTEDGGSDSGTSKTGTGGSGSSENGPNDDDPDVSDQSSPKDGSEQDQDQEPDTGFAKTQAEVEELQIDTDRLRVFLTSSGATVRRVLLKEYFNRFGIDPDSDEAKDPANWLEVVPELEAGKRLCSLRQDLTEDQRLKPDLDEAPWIIESRPDSSASSRNQEQEIRFRFEDGRGFGYAKTFTFRPGDLHFDLEVEVENIGNETRSGTADFLLRTGPGIFAEGKTAFSAGPRVAVASRDEDEVDVEMIPLDEVEDGPLVTRGAASSPILWAGSTNNYFSVIVSPRGTNPFQTVITTALVNDSAYEEALEQFQATNGSLPGTTESEAIRAGLRTGVGCESTFRLVIPEVNKSESQTFKVFTGPKDPTLMDEASYAEFYPLIEANYTFGTIEKTLLGILRFFEGITGNWGLAIILLTVLVRAILFPLQRVQSKAMSKYQAAMKKMKPKLEVIQKKYKNNVRKLREEQMKLMRETGAKPPLLGCLIMLIPIPVFIGLFVSLRTSFELRHAPFIGWIHDLSQPDQLIALPFKIPLLPGGDFINLLPILMTIAWVAQHAVTPVPEGTTSPANA